MIAIKVGGSLYDWPDLGDRLRAFVSSLADPCCLIVPGGGDGADAVRGLDRVHQLGPLVSHWLALRVCTVNAYFLRTLLPAFDLVENPAMMTRSGILDPFAFATLDEGRPGSLPHCWEATSDSVAGRAAVVGGGSLILLKSAPLPENLAPGDWRGMADAGYIDPILPGVIEASGLQVTVVNLRGWPRG